MQNATFSQATAILDLITTNGKPVDSSEIEMRTSLRPTAMIRLLSAMVEEGWLIRVNEHYFLGPKVMDWGVSAICSDNLIERATPTMEALFAKTGLDVGLAVYSAPDMVFVKTVGVTRDPTGPRVGIPIPAHLLGNGRVVLATFPENYISAYARTYLSEMTADEIRVRVLDPIRQTRARGYGLTGSDKIGAVDAMSYPIFDFSRTAIASLNLWRPSRYGESDLSELESMFPSLKCASEKISESLGLRSHQGAA